MNRHPMIRALERAALPLVVLLALSNPTESHAQTGPFGKNKVQYANFDWQVLSGENVDVYYYPEEEEVAKMALVFAEVSFRSLREKFQHHPFQRVPLVVYSSARHFEQTNVTAGFIPENVLGFTEFMKGRVALPFRGSYAQFRHTLRHELVHYFQLSKLAETYELHQGGRNRAVLPHWWVEGLAEFWSSPQDTRDEMVIRDVVLQGRVPSLADFSRSRAFLAYPLGGELHHYLAGRFGERRIVEMYEELWRYRTFEEAFRGVYGITVQEMDAEWRHHLEQRYFPLRAERPAIDVSADRLLTDRGPHFKPLVHQGPDDGAPQLFYMSPASGYTNIYRSALDTRSSRIRASRGRSVVEGQRSAEFESFNPYESRIDVSSGGILAFVSRFQGGDALFLWSSGKKKIVGRYRWDDLVGLQSPAWSPDGTKVVFSGLSLGGMSNLYVLDFESGERTALTSDPYEDLDPDWSPDGRFIVFSSDRTPFGKKGAKNLFLYDVDAEAMEFLTYGKWKDEAPRWSGDGSRIAFTSDRGGIYEIYTVQPDGSGRRVSDFSDAAMDPEWLPGDEGLIFSAYTRGTFQLYHLALDSASGSEGAPGDRIIALDLPDEAPPTEGPWLAASSVGMNGTVDALPQEGTRTTPPPWVWAELAAVDTVAMEKRDYSPSRSFSMDIAGGDAMIVPGLGATQGLRVMGSDMLGDHILHLGLSATQTRSLRNLPNAFSGQLTYLNMSRRLNLGGGISHFKGAFQDVAWDLYEESSYGAFFLASYPFSQFERLELQLGVEKSDRVDRERLRSSPDLREDPRDLTREGLITRNVLSYVKDNTLWLPYGPIDGTRYNVSAGLITDLTNARAESVMLSADYRRYFRTSQQSAFALRGFGYYSTGAIPGRTVLGGPHQLRGYPHRTLAGSRVLLVNSEWRFPLLQALTFHLPIGNVTFPGLQGALFADVGSSWLESQDPEGAWGAYGMAFRMTLGGPMVLRMDVGRRFRFGDEPPLHYRGENTFSSSFMEFFIGFNY